MADTKVSALAAATASLAADEFPVNEAGTSKKVTVQQLFDLVQALMLQSDQGRLRLAGSTTRMPLPGTMRMMLAGPGTDEVAILGQPRSGFTVPTDYALDSSTRRLTLSLTGRATLQGTAKLNITDDFSQRARLTLAGPGGQ